MGVSVRMVSSTDRISQDASMDEENTTKKTGKRNCHIKVSDPKIAKAGLRIQFMH